MIQLLAWVRWQHTLRTLFKHIIISFEQSQALAKECALLSSQFGDNRCLIFAVLKYFSVINLDWQIVAIMREAPRGSHWIIQSDSVSDGGRATWTAMPMPAGVATGQRWASVALWASAVGCNSSHAGLASSQLHEVLVLYRNMIAVLKTVEVLVGMSATKRLKIRAV